MKRKVCMALVLLMVFVSICGCSPGVDPKDTPATVDGVEISANEIIREEGGGRYLANYSEKKVSVVGTVKSVERGYRKYLAEKEVPVYKVLIKEGWMVHMLVEDNPHIANVKVGDTVSIQSRIDVYDTEKKCIIMEDVASRGTGIYTEYSDDSFLRVISK